MHGKPKASFDLLYCDIYFIARSGNEPVIFPRYADNDVLNGTAFFFF